MRYKAGGKGFKNESFYTNMRFSFFAIENIHVMRGSLQKLVEAVSQENTLTSLLSALDACAWLKHLRMVLEAANFLTESLVKGISCVVHCSDGWDRTAQAISLGCILLDPFYRTVSGFHILIEKDWLSFGHKFSDRCGHTQGDAKEVSPIFTQFLDCVWQLMVQFPRTFQFNERYLLTLHDHVHSCQFGTFLGNCEKDRVDLRLSERTYSLWGYLAHQADDFLNPLYDHKVAIAQSVLKPDLRAHLIRLWTGMYNRFDAGIHPRESPIERYAVAKDHTECLEDHVHLLSKKIGDLKLLVGSSIKSPSSSTMNDSGLFVSPSQQRRHKSGGDPLTASSSADCRCDSGAHDQALTKMSTDCESGIGGEECSLGKVLPPVAGSGERAARPSRMLTSSNFTASLDASLLVTSAPELNTVAVRWKSLRSATQCGCGTEFIHSLKKHHCRKCGEIYCTRCVDGRVKLPGLSSQREVQVCRNCQSALKELV